MKELLVKFLVLLSILFFVISCSNIDPTSSSSGNDGIGTVKSISDEEIIIPDLLSGSLEKVSFHGVLKVENGILSTGEDENNMATIPTALIEENSPTITGDDKTKILGSIESSLQSFKDDENTGINFSKSIVEIVQNGRLSFNVNSERANNVNETVKFKITLFTKINYKFKNGIDAGKKKEIYGLIKIEKGVTDIPEEDFDKTKTKLNFSSMNKGNIQIPEQKEVSVDFAEDTPKIKINAFVMGESDDSKLVSAIKESLINSDSPDGLFFDSIEVNAKTKVNIGSYTYIISNIKSYTGILKPITLTVNVAVVDSQIITDSIVNAIDFKPDNGSPAGVGYNSKFSVGSLDAQVVIVQGQSITYESIANVIVSEISSAFENTVGIKKATATILSIPQGRVIEEEGNVKAVEIKNISFKITVTTDAGYAFLVASKQVLQKEFNTTVNIKIIKLIEEVLAGNTENVQSIVELGTDIEIKSPYPNPTYAATPLILAAKNGFTDIVKILLTYSANKNAKDTQKKTALNYATENNYTEIVNLLSDTSANAEDLLDAAKNGNLYEVNYLISAGVNVHYKGTGGNTALILASQNGHTDVVESLIKAGSKLNTQNNNNNTALYIASEFGHINVVNALIEAGADLDIASVDTPLMIAIIERHTDIAHKLIEAGADIDKPGRYGWRPLFMAASRNDTNLVKALIDKNADLELRCNKDKGNYTALAHAVSSTIDNEEAILMLIDAGANINETQHGVTTLAHTIDRGIIKAAEALIKAGADVNAYTKRVGYGFAYYPLTIAADRNRVESLKLLLRYGADVNIHEDNGALKTALVYAMENDYKDIIKILEDAGGLYQYSVLDAVKNNDLEKVKTVLASEFIKENALYDILDNDEKSSLIFAAENGYTEITKALIDAGANINKESGYSSKRKTALIFAATGGHVEVVKLLLTANVIVQHQDSDNKTALDYATENNHTEIVALLSKIFGDSDDLIKAVESNDLAKVRTLITAGVNLDTFGKDNDGNSVTALTEATYRDYRDIMHALINAGANLNIQDNDGDTALMTAVGSDYIELETLKVLITAGAKLDIQRPFGSYNSGGETALILSVDNTEKAKALITAGANLDIQDNDGDTALMTAVDAHGGPYTETMNALIDAGANLDIQNNGGDTALMEAIFEDPATLKILIDAGADVNIQDNIGWTALRSSVYYPENAKLLIDAGANLDIQGNDGITALMEASNSERINEKRVKTQKYLIDAGADVNIRANADWTALTYAVASMSDGGENYTFGLQAALNLIKASPTADNNIYTIYANYTILILASSHGYKEIVDALIAKNVNLDIKSGDNKAALDYAIENGHTEIKNALIAAGAKDSPIAIITAAKTGDLNKVNQLIAQDFEVDYRDSEGITALMHAAQNRHEAVANALINAGADIEAQRPFYKYSVLLYACVGGDINIVRKLLDLGADIEVKDRTSRRPLMIAAGNGHGDVTKLIIDRGADIHAIDANRSNALMYVAFATGDVVSARHLIDAGIDIEAQGKDRYTALLHAVNTGAYEILNLLIEKNVNVNARTKYGNNALYYAYYGYVGASTDENKRPNFKKCFDILLGTDINLDLKYINSSDSTILMLVANAGEFECVKALLAAGADKTIVNKYGKTAEDVATTSEIKEYIKNFVYIP